MSLKAIHIVFITCSTLLAFGFAAWSLRNYFAIDGKAGDLGFGIGAAALGVGLIGYGRYFLKKLRSVSYL